MRGRRTPRLLLAVLAELALLAAHAQDAAAGAEAEAQGCAPNTEETRLKRDLLRCYDALSPPPNAPDVAVAVFFTGVQVENRQGGYTAWVYGTAEWSWFDHRLRWSSPFVQEIRVDSQKIWEPQHPLYAPALGQSGTLCRVEVHGLVVCLHFTEIQVPCEADARGWPADRLQCSATADPRRRPTPLNVSQVDAMPGSSEAYWALERIEGTPSELRLALRRKDAVHGAIAVAPGVVLPLLPLLSLRMAAPQRGLVLATATMAHLLLLTYLGERAPFGGEHPPSAVLLHRDALLLAALAAAATVAAAGAGRARGAGPAWAGAAMRGVLGSSFGRALRSAWRLSRCCPPSALPPLPLLPLRRPRPPVVDAATEAGASQQQEEATASETADNAGANTLHNHNQDAREDFPDGPDLWREASKLLDAMCFVVLAVGYALLLVLRMP